MMAHMEWIQGEVERRLQKPRGGAGVMDSDEEGEEGKRKEGKEGEELPFPYLSRQSFAIFAFNCKGDCLRSMFLSRNN